MRLKGSDRDTYDSGKFTGCPVLCIQRPRHLAQRPSTQGPCYPQPRRVTAAKPACARSLIRSRSLGDRPKRGAPAGALWPPIGGKSVGDLARRFLARCRR